VAGSSEHGIERRVLLSEMCRQALMFPRKILFPSSVSKNKTLLVESLAYLSMVLRWLVETLVTDYRNIQHRIAEDCTLHGQY
jgi:hypothetical protein